MTPPHPPGLEPGTCRACTANILWAVTVNGKKVPLDAKPEKRYVLARSEVQPQPPGLVTVLDTYISHFATCPHAARFRQPKGATADDRASP